MPGTPGAVTRGDTHANGTAYQAPFFTYPTTAAAADAYAAWMTRHNARTAGTENDPAAYGEALRRAGYMENPNAPGAIAQARRGLVIPLTAAQNATETLERTLHLAPGALRGLGAGTPLGGGSNDNSTTHAPVLNQTTNINVQGAGADTARQVMDGQRSINQDASRALQGGTR